MVEEMPMHFHPSSLPCTLPSTGAGHTLSLVAIAMVGLALGGTLLGVAKRRRLPVAIILMLLVGVAAVHTARPASAGCPDVITIVNAGSVNYNTDPLSTVPIGTDVDVCEQASPTNCVHLLTTDPIGKQYKLTVASSPTNLIATEMGSGTGLGVSVFDHSPTTTEMNGPTDYIVSNVPCGKAAVTDPWPASNGNDYWVAVFSTC